MKTAAGFVVIFVRAVFVLVGMLAFLTLVFSL